MELNIRQKTNAFTHIYTLSYMHKYDVDTVDMQMHVPESLQESSCSQRCSTSLILLLTVVPIQSITFPFLILFTCNCSDCAHLLHLLSKLKFSTYFYSSLSESPIQNTIPSIHCSRCRRAWWKETDEVEELFNKVTSWYTNIFYVLIEEKIMQLDFWALLKNFPFLILSPYDEPL